MELENGKRGMLELEKYLYVSFCILLYLFVFFCIFLFRQQFPIAGLPQLLRNWYIRQKS